MNRKNVSLFCDRYTKIQQSEQRQGARSFGTPARHISAHMCQLILDKESTVRNCLPWNDTYGSHHFFHGSQGWLQSVHLYIESSNGSHMGRHMAELYIHNSCRDHPEGAVGLLTVAIFADLLYTFLIFWTRRRKGQWRRQNKSKSCFD